VSTGEPQTLKPRTIWQSGRGAKPSDHSRPIPAGADKPSRGAVLKQRCSDRAGGGGSGHRCPNNTSPGGGGGRWNCGVKNSFDHIRDYD